MILDSLQNHTLYTSENPAMARAFGRLLQLAANPPADGRYAGEDDGFYYMVQRYPTRPVTQCKWESHRQYIDIQYIASGQEWMGHAERGGLQPTDYLPEKDFDGYEPADPHGYNMLHVRAGQFVVFYPQDAHMPCLCNEQDPGEVVKIVFKVKVSPQ